MVARYAAVGWHELVNIQAPKDRAWARDERALDLLAKCLEVRCNVQYVAVPSRSFPNGIIRCCVCDLGPQVDPSKRISAETALAHEYFTSYACLFSPTFSAYYTSNRVLFSPASTTAVLQTPPLSPLAPLSLAPLILQSAARPTRRPGGPT